MLTFSSDTPADNSKQLAVHLCNRARLGKAAYIKGPEYSGTQHVHLNGLAEMNSIQINTCKLLWPVHCAR